MWAEAVGWQCGLKLSEGSVDLSCRRAVWAEAVGGQCGLKLSEGNVG